MRSRKRPEKRIVVKRVETIAIPTEVLATSASNMAGGTIMVRNALRLLQGIPKEQLQSSGLFDYYKDIAFASQKLDATEERHRSIYGYAERLEGHILQKLVRDYYEAEGYSIKETDEKTDKDFKIDLVAEKNNEIRTIQVKKGTVSSQEIREICEKASTYLKQKTSNQKMKIIEIFAQHFPINYLQIRDEFMKKQNEVTLNYRTFHQIITKVPKYRFLHV